MTIVKTVQLADVEIQATIAALYAYRDETVSYLRNFGEQTHEDCCKVGQMRTRLARERQDALNARLREIDGALQALED